MFAYRWGSGRLSQPSWAQVAALVDSQATRLGADRVIGLVTGTKDDRYLVFAKWAIGVAVRSEGGAGRPAFPYDPRVVGWRPVRIAGDSIPTASMARLDERALRASRLALAARGIYVAESESDARELVAAQFRHSDPAGAPDADMTSLVLQVEAHDHGRSLRAALLSERGRDPVWDSAEGDSVTALDAGESFWFGNDQAIAGAVQAMFDSLPALPGLLDGDHDGVADYKDREAATVPGAEVDAFGFALDDDADGVPNGIDRDPNTPAGALVNTWGEPLDSDHDSVYDGLDECPNTPADLAVDSTGCEIEVTWVEKGLLDVGRVVEQRIRFSTGRSDLLRESYATLDEIGSALSDLPDLRFEVGGHCDERGSDELNMALSEDRARTVVQYLLAHFPGIHSEQLVARGYGKTVPIAPNTSPENMARNRRVEFVVLNPDRLRQQILHRRYLRRGEAPGRR